MPLLRPPVEERRMSVMQCDLQSLRRAFSFSSGDTERDDLIALAMPGRNAVLASMRHRRHRRRRRRSLQPQARRRLSRRLRCGGTHIREGG